MTLTQLKYVITAAEANSMNEAAKQLFIKKLTRIPQPLQAGDELCKALPG